MISAIFGWQGPSDDNPFGEPQYYANNLVAGGHLQQKSNGAFFKNTRGAAEEDQPRRAHGRELAEASPSSTARRRRRQRRRRQPEVQGEELRRRSSCLSAAGPTGAAGRVPVGGAPARRLGPRDPQRARLRHRPLQLPLPLLHAGGGAAVAPNARSVLSFEEIARLVAGPGGDGRRRGPAHRRRAARAPRAARLVGMLAAVTGRPRPVAHHQRRPARPPRRPARRGRPAADQHLARLAVAHPLRRDHPPRRARSRAAGARAAERFPQLRPIKVNCVAIRGFTESEVPASRRARAPQAATSCASSSSCRSTPIKRWAADRCSPAPRSARSSSATGRSCEIPAKPSSTARRFRFADGAREIGFVNPVSEPFCSDCDRIRLTADGQLRTCLFSRREWDLREPLRDRAPTTTSSRRSSGGAVGHKELKHRINEPGFVPASRSMSQIGG